MHQKVETTTVGVPLSTIDKRAAFYSRSVIPEVLLRPDVELRQARLSGVIASEIVPRLLMLHQQSRNAALPFDPPSQLEIEEFGALAMGAEVGAALHYFEKMRAKGHSRDTLFVHFLAPTARYLGELWEQDRCDFIDVTLGVARLQALLSIFGAHEEAPVQDMHRRALLATIPGEKHVFGVDMVAKFMRSGGWDVTVAMAISANDAAVRVAREWFGVAGITLSWEGGLETVGQTIKAIRKASLNPAIGVLVGGPAFARNPELAIRVGADATAPDAPTAIILAQKLLSAKTDGRRARP